MKYWVIVLIMALSPVISLAFTSTQYYGPSLCKYPQFQCIKVRGQSWKKLFPDQVQRDLVQRLNRTYNPLWRGKIIAVPKALKIMTLFDLSPFTLKIEPSSNKEIIIDQEKLAWAAYNEQGQLVKWGPISSGQDKCSDSNKSCRTLTGVYQIYSKEKEDCVSRAYPTGIGGAKMPYCMFYHKGFAIHGSDDMPGHRASHGCVRLFTEDAKWLNENFVQIANKTNNFSGTVIIIRPLLD